VKRNYYAWRFGVEIKQDTNYIIKNENTFTRYGCNKLQQQIYGAHRVISEVLEVMLLMMKLQAMF
jgi:hypothetical protein